MIYLYTIITNIIIIPYCKNLFYNNMRNITIILLLCCVSPGTNKETLAIYPKAIPISWHQSQPNYLKVLIHLLMGIYLM